MGKARRRRDGLGEEAGGVGQAMNRETSGRRCQRGIEWAWGGRKHRVVEVGVGRGVVQEPLPVSSRRGTCVDPGRRGRRRGSGSGTASGASGASGGGRDASGRVERTGRVDGVRKSVVGMRTPPQGAKHWTETLGPSMAAFGTMYSDLSSTEGHVRTFMP